MTNNFPFEDILIDKKFNKYSDVKGFNNYRMSTITEKTESNNINSSDDSYFINKI